MERKTYNITMVLVMVKSSPPQPFGFVNRDRLVDLTCELVKIPSVTGEEKEIAEFITRHMENLGLEVDVTSSDPQRPNVVGRLRGSLGRPVLIYNSHMDTVPIGDKTLWTHDPLGAEIIEGKIYGRGAQDMKGGLAAMLEMVAAIRDAHIKLDGDLVLEAVVDEERGGYKGTKWLVDRGITGDFGVVCEGGDLKLHVCHKGDYGVEIETTGKVAHAAMPEKGINAVHKMISIANALLKIPKKYQWETRKHDLLGHSLLNLSVIEGGIQRNMIPNKCRMVVDRRVVPGLETLDDARREIRDVIRDLEKRDRNLKVEIREIIAVEPAEISRDEPIVKAFQSAAKKVMAHELEISGVKGFTDAHWMVNDLGIPTVSFGTWSGNIHAVDEYTEIQSLVQTGQIYTQVAVDLLTSSSPQP